MSKLQLRKKQFQLVRKLLILTGFLILGLKALPQSDSSGISLSGSISTKNVNLNLKVGGSGHMQSDKADQMKQSTGMRGGQQLQARLVDNTIQLSDGRIFTITSTTPRMGLHYTVDIREPANARVTLTFVRTKALLRIQEPSLPHSKHTQDAVTLTT